MKTIARLLASMLLGVGALGCVQSADLGAPDGAADAGYDLCGDGVLNEHEDCDVAITGSAGACPSSCDDGVACTADRLLGADCGQRCAHEEVVSCATGDGCCPAGCEPSSDGDCTRTCGDGGCPAGCDPSSDGDCSRTCGDGMLDPSETCDTAIAAGPGACPSSCDDGVACTSDALVGAACSVACTHAPIAVCRSGDGCCPSACDAASDGDCSPSCGDGVLDASEVCDGDCPTSCDDADACTDDALVGSASRCSAECTHEDIDACAGGDGCCPAGCDAVSDDDCAPECGNGVLEPSETCDGDCPTSCDDGAACTVDALSGSAASCTSMCTHAPITACASDDGCCPSGCRLANDAECPGAWRPPARLGSSMFGSAPLMTMDGSGNTLAVVRNGDHPFLSWSRFAAGAWGPLAALPSGGYEGNVRGLALAGNDAGEAVLLLAVSDGTDRELDNSRYVIAVRYDPAFGWRAPEGLRPTGALGPGLDGMDVAIDASGEMTAVWTQYSITSGTSDVWAARGTRVGWSTPERISSAGYVARSPDVDIDDDGTSVVVWSEIDAASGGRRSVHAARHRPGAGWSADVELDGDDALGAAVTLTGDGDAIALWSRWDGLEGSIWSSRFSAALSGWTAATELARAAGEVFSGSIVTLSTGEALALWMGDGRDRYFTSRYVAGIGWTLPSTLPVPEPVHAAAFVSNRRGDAILAWTTARDDGSFTVRARRASAAHGWSAVEHIGDGGPANVPLVSAAIDSRGRCVVAWSAVVLSSPSEIHASRFE